MTCPRAARLLSARLDGALDARERDAVEAHLASCGACRTRDAELARVRGFLRSVEPTDDVPGRAWSVATAVLEEARRPAPRPSRAPAVMVAAAAALAVCACAAALIARRPKEQPVPDAPAVQVGRFAVTLDEPDAELLDRLSSRFRTLGAVEETRAARSLEVRYRYEVTAEAEARHEALREYLRGFAVANGSWEWSVGREPAVSEPEGRVEPR